VLISALVAEVSSSSWFSWFIRLGQGSYTAQVRGTVTDPAHGVVNNAKVTVTNDSTSIAITATTNASGEYVVNGLRPPRATPARWRRLASAMWCGRDWVLATSQQATVDFALGPRI
jgi:hypothetical protein